MGVIEWDGGMERRSMIEGRRRDGCECTFLFPFFAAAGSRRQCYVIRCNPACCLSILPREGEKRTGRIVLYGYMRHHKFPVEDYFTTPVLSPTAIAEGINGRCARYHIIPREMKSGIPK